MSEANTGFSSIDPMVDTIDNYIKSESVLNRLLTAITLDRDLAATAEEMLRIIGENAAADRCGLFEYQGGSAEDPVMRYEWVAPASKNTAEATARSTRSHFAEYYPFLIERRPVIIENVDCHPEGLSGAAQDLKSRGIRSRLVSGIWIDDRLHGFIVMDYLNACKYFSQCDVTIIGNAAHLYRISYERDRRYAQLLESDSLLQQIMNNISTPIMLVDPEFRVYAANPSKKVNVPLSESQLRGSHCYDTVCKFGSPPDFCAVAETIRTRKPCKKAFSFGDKHLVMTAHPVFDLNGNMIRVLTTDLDITEVTHQKEELKIAMELAQAANHAKSYFLATVSHELRTPLNAVIGFSELLQNGGIDEKTQQEYLRSINFAGTALLNLINDVLDLSNLEANQTLIDPVKNDVADLLRQILSVFKLKGIQKDIAIEADTAGIAHPLYVDNLRLRQILLNLIGNDVKFTSRGRVAVKGVFTPFNGEEGALEISVTDTGAGISPENQQRIFEPFVHDSVIRGKRMYEGSGLGLTITKRLLDKMGGDIRLESELGEGSTFTIRLNHVKYEAGEALAAPGDSPATPAADPAGKTGTPLRVLLVDDVPLNLKVLDAMLKKLGVETTLADSARAALDQLRDDRAYDMILTDMWMPEISGTEMADLIRNEMEITGIPIVAVTADTQISPEDKARFSHVLHKPITIAALKQMFGALLPQKPI